MPRQKFWLEGILYDFKPATPHWTKGDLPHLQPREVPRRVYEYS